MADISQQPYPGAIRVLHWLVLALVIVQWLSAGGMEAFFDQVRSGPASILPNTTGSVVHALSGTAILILMAARFMVRARSEISGPPRDLARPLWWLSLANHYAFYAVLILLPLTGLASLLLSHDIAAVHKALKTLLLVLLGLHLAGVAYHMLVLRDGALWRMLRL